MLWDTLPQRYISKFTSQQNSWCAAGFWVSVFDLRVVSIGSEIVSMFLDVPGAGGILNKVLGGVSWLAAG